MPGEEFTVRVRILATDDVSDEFLEELTILVEDAISEDAAEIAPGGSASANFETHTIELDFTVAAASPEEMHQKVGEVVRIALAAVPEREPQSVMFADSATSSVLAAA
ncbi:MAG TPA: hypothetical protein VK790_11045 [Solirubrobacteraceae bacterium]|nr:hypothetical protein [Solirubrobacteraceae bacterium]